MRLGVLAFGLLAGLVMALWLLRKPHWIGSPKEDGQDITGQGGQQSRRDGHESKLPPHLEPSTAPTVLPAPTARGHNLEVAAERRRALWRKQHGAQSQAGTASDAGLPQPPADFPELDAAYLQKHLEEDFNPLAQSCYEALLENNPEAAGLVELGFTIVGDEAVGGVVESVQLGGKFSLLSRAFSYCVTESLLSVYFEAPPKAGKTSVVVPIEFAPERSGVGALP